MLKCTSASSCIATAWQRRSSTSSGRTPSLLQLLQLPKGVRLWQRKQQQQFTRHCRRYNHGYEPSPRPPAAAHTHIHADPRHRLLATTRTPPAVHGRCSSGSSAGDRIQQQRDRARDIFKASIVKARGQAWLNAARQQQQQQRAGRQTTYAHAIKAYAPTPYHRGEAPSHAMSETQSRTAPSEKPSSLFSQPRFQFLAFYLAFVTPKWGIDGALRALMSSPLVMHSELMSHATQQGLELTYWAAANLGGTVLHAVIFVSLMRIFNVGVLGTGGPVTIKDHVSFAWSDLGKQEAAGVVGTTRFATQRQHENHRHREQEKEDAQQQWQGWFKACFRLFDAASQQTRLGRMGTVLLMVVIGSVALDQTANLARALYCVVLNIMGEEMDFDAQLELKRLAARGGRLADWGWVITTIAFPVVEEVFFRGLLLRYLLHLGLGPSGAIIISALMFAEVHEDALFPETLLMGVVLGMSYVVSRCILVPIGIHVLNNAAAMEFWRSFVPQNDEIDSTIVFIARRMVDDGGVDVQLKMSTLRALHVEGMTEALRHMVDSEVQQLKIISFTVFLRAFVSSFFGFEPQGPPGPDPWSPMVQGQLKEIFAALDADGDGLLNATELADLVFTDSRLMHILSICAGDHVYGFDRDLHSLEQYISDFVTAYHGIASHGGGWNFDQFYTYFVAGLVLRPTSTWLQMMRLGADIESFVQPTESEFWTRQTKPTDTVHMACAACGCVARPNQGKLHKVRTGASGGPADQKMKQQVPDSAGGDVRNMRSADFESPSLHVQSAAVTGDMYSVCLDCGYPICGRCYAFSDRHSCTPDILPKIDALYGEQGNGRDQFVKNSRWFMKQRNKK